MTIIDSNGRPVIGFYGKDGQVSIGTLLNPGKLFLVDSSGKQVFRVYGQSAQLVIGDAGNGGSIFIRDSSGKDVFRFLGQNSMLDIGGLNKAGNVNIKDSSGKDVLKFDGNGKVWMLNESKPVITFSKDGNISLGGNGLVDGSITLKTKDEKSGIVVDANHHQISMFKNDKATITMSGDSGDILFHNADCAEEFDISESENAQPGTVMVFDNGDKLVESKKAYDKRVAGVISGACNLKPGIVLGKKQSHSKRAPLAILGKVFCKVDASKSSVDVGDLLTTSNVPGHAMKATNRSRAFGSVIGKALQSFRNGRSMIPILIALQ
jgi:hypothetical protein